MFEVPLWLASLFFLGALLAADRMRRRLNDCRRRLELAGKELEAARAEIAEADRLRSEILSRIGSALRKPLASIRTAAEEVSRPFECPDWVKEQLQLLSNEVENISSFINLIGEISSVETLPAGRDQARVVADVVDLEGLLVDVVQSAGGRLAEKGVSLAAAIDPEIVVLGEERYLRQAVQSLVEEAVRHAGRGSILQVDLSAMDGHARLVLDHRGPSDTEDSGTALGTELARQILGAHGGRLLEGSHRGQFTASLPVAERRPGPGEGGAVEPGYIQEV